MTSKNYNIETIIQEDDLTALKEIIDDENINDVFTDNTTPIHKSLLSQSTNCFLYLLSKKPDLRIVDNQGRNILHSAAWLSLNFMLIKIVQQDPAIISTQDSHGRTALHYLAYNANIKAMKMIHQYLSEIDYGVLEQSGKSPLDVACVRYQELDNPLDKSVYRGFLSYIYTSSPKSIQKKAKKTFPELKRILKKQICNSLNNLAGYYLFLVSSFIFAFFNPSPLSIFLATIQLTAVVSFKYLDKGALKVKNLDKIVDICPSCDTPKYKNTHHCRRCNRCIHDFDHHCVWLDSCVCKANFAAFLFILKESIANYLIFLMIYLIRIINARKSDYVAMVMAILAVVSSIFVAYLYYQNVKYRREWS